jgi:gliding motility-associated-like protein
MKSFPNSFFLVLFILIIKTETLCSQNYISSDRLTNQNLELKVCDDNGDGFTSLIIKEIEDYATQTIGIENNYYLEQVLISTSKGYIHAVNFPSSNPSISTLCNLGGSLTDIAVNSNQEIFLCGSANISKIDDSCNRFYYNYSFFENNALSFDDLDNLYIGIGTESSVYRHTIDLAGVFSSTLWHDFEIGVSGGDFVLLDDKIYMSWRLAINNYRLYEVKVDANRDYISHIDLGQLPNETYGLSSELGNLYGVTPNKLFKINLTKFTFLDIIQNPNPEDKWYGAAGLHEALMFDVSTHLTLNDAENGTNEITGDWKNTIPGGQTVYIKIENSSTGAYDIVLLDIIISSYPNVNLPLDIVKCSNGDTNVFDLERVSSQMTIDPNDNLLFTYYNTDPERNGASNQLPLQYQSINTIETLFVTVENGNSGCKSIYNFQVITNETPKLLPISTIERPTLLQSCYFDQNDMGYFNLNDIENIIVLGKENLEIKYYLRYSDAENNNYQLSNIFYLENPVQEIFIKATNAQGCYTISNFYLYADCFISNVSLKNIIFPKFFTPNNDGHNDFWNITGVSAKLKRESIITILDRYGKELCTFKPGSIIGWDGTSNGHRLPSSDYWFIFRTETGIEKVGHFTLKR